MSILRHCSVAVSTQINTRILPPKPTPHRNSKKVLCKRRSGLTRYTAVTIIYSGQMFSRLQRSAEGSAVSQYYCRAADSRHMSASFVCMQPFCGSKWPQPYIYILHDAVLDSEECWSMAGVCGYYQLTAMAWLAAGEYCTPHC